MQPSLDPQSADSYYLIDLARPDSLHFRLPPMPAGEYRGIEFTVGVDEGAAVEVVQLVVEDAGEAVV